MTNAPRPHVLLVDDDELLVNAVLRVLRQTRWPVLAAGTAEEAGAQLTGHEVGVIVCEPRDPQLAAFLINVRERDPNIVRLILTGYPNMTSVLKTINEANPFKLLFKPWLDEELLATVNLAFELYAVNRKRDQLIEEYADIRTNAERVHALRLLGALAHSTHPDMNDTAIHDLPVSALLVNDGAVALVNLAARRYFAELGRPVPEAGSAVSDLPTVLAALVAAALVAPQRQRASSRTPDGRRLDYFVLEIATGTLIAFAPLP